MIAKPNDLGKTSETSTDTHIAVSETVPEGMESPEGAIPFEVVMVDDDGNEINSTTFDPVYYPDRFTTKGGKEINRNARQCGGETVDIKSLNNEELHATGVLKSSTIQKFRYIANWDGDVILYTPLQPTGGIEAVIKKWEIGDLDGWDPALNEWLVEWTLDFVGTGKDEHERTNENETVSGIIDSI
ncbi:MAG: hypothetical protein ABEI86_14595 [Halobacteriaceae archaeon]